MYAPIYKKSCYVYLQESDGERRTGSDGNSDGDLDAAIVLSLNQAEQAAAAVDEEKPKKRRKKFKRRKGGFDENDAEVAAIMPANEKEKVSLMCD